MTTEILAALSALAPGDASELHRHAERLGLNDLGVVIVPVGWREKVAVEIEVSASVPGLRPRQYQVVDVPRDAIEQDMARALADHARKAVNDLAAKVSRTAPCG